MYITGDLSNFETRLHQLAESDADLTSFQTEGAAYANQVSENIVVKWNREFRKIHFEVAGEWNDSDYITQ